MNAHADNVTAVHATAVSRMAWLLGQPALGDYLHFVRNQTIGGAARMERELVDEWRIANDYYFELETSEADIANTIDTRSLGRKARKAVAALEADPQYMSAFNLVPTEVRMVELDKLIVSQNHIDLTHTDRIMGGLGPDADEETLLRHCLRPNAAATEIAVEKRGGDGFRLSSMSSDLRYHKAAVFQPGEIALSDKMRANATVLGLIVGYSSNFLSAIASDDRLVLYNGHHRAYALKALGYTHAPCIVQTVTRRDELNVIASGDLASEPALYFKARRPPMLRDFFDARIRKTFDMKRVTRVIEIDFKVREFEVAE